MSTALLTASPNVASLVADPLTPSQLDQLDPRIWATVLYVREKLNTELEQLGSAIDLDDPAPEKTRIQLIQELEVVKTANNDLVAILQKQIDAGLSTIDKQLKEVQQTLQEDLELIAMGDY